MKKITIIYSSVTGNTKKVAEHTFNFLKNLQNNSNSSKKDKDESGCIIATSDSESYNKNPLFDVEIYDIKNFTKPNSENEENKKSSPDSASKDDIIIIFFWCRRTSMDDLSLDLLNRLRGKKVLAIGTLSGDAKGKYGDRVRKNVADVVSNESNCLGVHLCQGHSSLKRIEPRRHLEPSTPKYISPEKWEHHLSMQHHPDERDIAETLDFIEKSLGL